MKDELVKIPDANHIDTLSSATYRISPSPSFKSHQLQPPHSNINKLPPPPLLQNSSTPAQAPHSPKQLYPRRNWHPKGEDNHPYKMPQSALSWEKMRMKGISPILHYRPSGVDRRWILPLSVASLVSLLLLLFTTLSSPLSFISFYLFAPTHLFVESKLHFPAPVAPTAPLPPRLAYLISGSSGDGQMLRRTLQALYHPRNLYVVHLDLESPPQERKDLLDYVAGHPVFAKVGNVRMITRANLITYRGPTMVANTLHAAAILLREGGQWDWFINLSASDYPLMTQDDLLYVFSHLPRDLNFIDHTSKIGWKEFHRAKPVIVDPGLYMLKKADVFWITQRRSVPTAFKLFTGSAWMALSHSFVDYCIWGWSNLPRTVLMYYSNFLSSPEGYFHTVICNAKEFINTTVNHDLHFISWDNPPKQHPHFLTINDFSSMVESSLPFARKFRADDPVLDKIDAELLHRHPGMLVPGLWCIGSKENSTDPCSVMGNTTALRPGPGSKKLESLVAALLSEDKFHPRQCL